VHHERARQWFGGTDRVFATCPITQGALVRHYYRDADKPEINGAFQLLRQIESMPGHEFWKDKLSYSEIKLTGVIGHRQVTDAYLVALAAICGGKLASMDQGLALLHHEKVVFIP
jgi:hypothetical protein